MGKIILIFFLGFIGILPLNGQILTFDFVGLAGSEATANSNFNNANISSSTISRGAGLTASANTDRYNATNWALTSIANAVTGNNYMQFTVTPNAGYSFSVSSIVISLQRSATGPSGIAVRSSADGYTTDLGGAQAIVDNTSTQTFTFTFSQTNGCNTAVTYRIYMFAEAAGGSGGPGDLAGNDIIVNGSVSSCAVNTISTGIVSGSPFAVTCSTSVAVNVPFTSTGTYNAGNIYTAQLSDASGSFASPTLIGTLSSTANSGTINATIPMSMPSGTLYRIRVISDNPSVTGTDNGTDLTVNFSAGGCGITTGVVTGSPFTVTCTNWQNTSVPFTTNGTYNAGNIFRVQLSDATGSFTYPLTIGELTLSGTNPSGSIPSTIFAGLTPGASYRIRVVSTDPVQTGADNGTNLTINNAGSPCFGPIVMNEVSQGPSGNFEYMEVLVIANDPCATMDIRNFIIDDNNGDFSGGPTSGVGIASGHIRFTNHNQWANVPSGSLIVIYNEDERNTSIPSDDPSDLLVPNKVYILPANSSFLEGCVTRPTSTDNAYTPCTYGIGDWDYISMANGADAAQVRYPNSTYSHGFSWGPAPMNGGPNSLNIGTGGVSSTVIEFENTTNNSYTTAANFTRTAVATGETPGAGNSVANTAYIASLICVALPVELTHFTAQKLETANYLSWATATETGTDHFIIERSVDMQTFTGIGKILAGGYTFTTTHYSFSDSYLIEGDVYYRLKIVDINGDFEFSQPRLISRHESEPKPFLAGTTLQLAPCEDFSTLMVYDMSGRLIEQKSVAPAAYALDHLPDGFYMIQIICNQSEYNFKISLTR